MTFEVYLDPCTVNSRKVLAGLDYLGTQYHLSHIDYFTGAHKTPEYMRINPCGTVPSAVDGDTRITESNAILMYAADRDGGSAAYPKDLGKRAEVNRWLLWEASVWFHSCYAYLVENVVKPLINSVPDQSVLEAEAPKWKTLATILDDQLAKTKWLCGDELTIADIAVAAPMHLHEAQKLPLEQFPNLKRWVDAIEGCDFWKKTQPAVDKALRPHLQAAETAEQSSEVKTTMNYTKHTYPKLTEIYFYDSPESKDIHEPGDDPQEVAVRNGWSKVKEFSIDKQGFALKDFTTKFGDWEDDDAVKSAFYPDVVEFLKKELGAKRVLVFDHTIRSNANEAKKLTVETNTSQRAPVMLVHCDYTSDSGPTRVKQLLPDEADDLLSRRVAFINVWKPINNIVEERPLAMCDVQSTVKEDFFKLHLRYRDRDGENYVLQHSPRHQWYYFPKMTPEQVVLLKTYDSETDGRARFVGHSAFEDPETPKNAPMRESVEIRTIAFF